MPTYPQSPQPHYSAVFFIALPYLFPEFSRFQEHKYTEPSYKGFLGQADSGKKPYTCL